MTKGNDTVDTVCSETLGVTINEGLTKREYFAAIAMQGLLSTISGTFNVNGEDIARTAVMLSDKLIEVLNKNQ